MFPSLPPSITTGRSSVAATPPTPGPQSPFVNSLFAMDFGRLSQPAGAGHAPHLAYSPIRQSPSTSPCTLHAPIVSARETPSAASMAGPGRVFIGFPGEGTSSGSSGDVAIAGSLLACTSPPVRSAVMAFGAEAEAMAADWKRHRTMAEIGPQPRESRFGPAAGSPHQSPPYAVLHKVLLMLSGGPEAIAAGGNTLEWQAFNTAVTESNFTEAKSLLEALTQRLESDHTLEHWGMAFEQLLLLSHRFEARAARAIGQTLMLPDCTCDEDVSALAATVTRARFDRVMAHRLNAAAAFPDEERGRAWHDLLDTLPRCTTLFNAERLTKLTKFIPLLPEAQRPQAALDVADATAQLREPGGRVALVDQLCGTVDAEMRFDVIQRLIRAAVPAPVDDLRETIETVAQELHRLPERDASELLDHLTRLASMEGEYEELLFDDAQSIELLASLRHISDCDKRGYARPELRALVRRRAFAYADVISE